MRTKQGKAMGTARFLGCFSLLALLSVCGYLGASRPQAAMVSVPVYIETIPEETAAAQSLEKTREAAQQRRNEALAIIQRVAQDPAAGAVQRSEALAQMQALAARMEQEAAVQKLLGEMGIAPAAVVLSEQAAMAFIPWQMGQEEPTRMRIIDAVSSLTGLEASCVKIILSKK